MTSSPVMLSLGTRHQVGAQGLHGWNRGLLHCARRLATSGAAVVAYRASVARAAHLEPVGRQPAVCRRLPLGEIRRCQPWSAGVGLMGLGLALVTVAVLFGDEWRLRQGDWRDEAVAMPLVHRRLDSEHFRCGPRTCHPPPWYAQRAATDCAVNDGIGTKRGKAPCPT
jgi:hypothetical protein